MRVKMANKSALFFLLLVVGFALVFSESSYDDERGKPEWEREQEGRREREWGRQEEGDMGGRGKKGREQEEERGRPEWERGQEGGREWGRQEEGDKGGRGKKGREQEEERGTPEWERGQEGGREWGRQEEGDMGGRGKKGREQEEERGREWEREKGRGGDEGDLFLLHDSEHVVRTDAGDMKVVKGYGGKFTQNNNMHIGFITMEPNSLFIPQYIDANLILFVSIGEAKLGYIYEDKLAEKQLKQGDVYRIPAGSAFYLVNTAEGQRLHIICSIDTSDSFGWQTFQSFFIGGGTNPTSVLAGFDPLTISTAFNVTIEELKGVMTRQRGGPIVYLSDGHAPTIWTKFLDSNNEQKLSQLKSVVHLERKTIRDEEDDQSKWSWRKLLKPLFGEENKKKSKGTASTGPDSYNLYDKDPDFKNDYGWSMALDEDDYSPLKHSGAGVYLVNLTAGSMMAPHVNPTATEYGIVLRGSGTIQVVYPDGSLAMKAEVNEGDVFWVPRYFPFCQIASRTGPFEFFGFTTSALKNRPQFLVGANSLLQTMMGPELAAAFGVSEETLRNVTSAQHESVILPSASALAPRREKEQEAGEGSRRGEKKEAGEDAPRRGEKKEAGEDVPRRGEDEDGKEMPKVIRSLANEMVMGFD